MPKQKYTERKKINNKKWDDANLKRGTYAISLDLYTQLEIYCKNNNISKNKLISNAISDKIGYTKP